MLAAHGDAIHGGLLNVQELFRAQESAQAERMQSMLEEIRNLLANSSSAQDENLSKELMSLRQDKYCQIQVRMQD